MARFMVNEIRLVYPGIARTAKQQSLFAIIASTQSPGSLLSSG